MHELAMAHVRRKCCSHGRIHHRHEQERTGLVSVVVLTQALALALALALVLALALALVLALSSALVRRRCHERQDCSCANQADNRHRDKELHDRHYRCCHCLEGRAREREQVIVSMRDIHQLSG